MVSLYHTGTNDDFEPLRGCRRSQNLTPGAPLSISGMISPRFSAAVLGVRNCRFIFFHGLGLCKGASGGNSFSERARHNERCAETANLKNLSRSMLGHRSSFKELSFKELSENVLKEVDFGKSLFVFRNRIHFPARPFRIDEKLGAT
jgi:hypothetical protein